MMFTILNYKNVSTYLIGDFMSLKCPSRLLYMEPRESGSYSVPSLLSTPRKNLTIILSRSLGGICPGALSSPIEVKKSDHFHHFMSPVSSSVTIRNLLFGTTFSFWLSESSFRFVDKSLGTADQVQRTRNLGFQFQIYSSASILDRSLYLK